jgi:diketogulonate reductase-like aldo/keto reductase
MKQVKKMKSIIVIAVITFSINLAYALDINQELNIHLDKVSNTKKTVLVNVGSDNGINVGDHASFYLNSEECGQAFAEKMTKNKSIWIFYKIDRSSEIIDNQFMQLRAIAKPPTELLTSGNDNLIKRQPASQPEKSNSEMTQEKKTIKEVSSTKENISEREWEKNRTVARANLSEKAW